MSRFKMYVSSPATSPPNSIATGTVGNVLTDLYENVRQALRLWHDSSADNPLGHLATFQPPTAHASVRSFINTRLLTLLDTMAECHAEEARILRMRYLDGMTAETVAFRLGMSTSNLSKQQKRAFLLLVERIEQAEQAHRAANQIRHLNRLEPPTYDRLFGVDALAAQLLELLHAPNQPWLLALEGIGGIGKTTLADAVMRQAIAQQHFAGFGWVSARQQRLHLSGVIQPLDQPILTAEDLLEQLALQLLTDDQPDAGALPAPVTKATVAQLTSYLKAVPHLIVVDNLETVADVEALLPTLAQLSNPTKFLLTSRTSLYSETATYPFTIPQLAESDALALVRHEADLRNRIEVAAAPISALRPIYETVGGNPLALRLVVGQTRIHALDLILADLKAARGQAATHLYTYIYRYAWDNLDDLSRRALIAMPFAPPRGTTLDHLQGISGLPADELHGALQQLVSLNLVNRSGDLSTSAYTIHSLTRTFLLEQVAQWLP